MGPFSSSLAGQSGAMTAAKKVRRYPIWASRTAVSTWISVPWVRGRAGRRGCSPARRVASQFGNLHVIGQWAQYADVPRGLFKLMWRARLSRTRSSAPDGNLLTSHRWRTQEISPLAEARRSALRRLADSRAMTTSRQTLDKRFAWPGRAERGRLSGSVRTSHRVTQRKLLERGTRTQRWRLASVHVAKVTDPTGGERGTRSALAGCASPARSVSATAMRRRRCENSWFL